MNYLVQVLNADGRVTFAQVVGRVEEIRHVLEIGDEETITFNNGVCVYKNTGSTDVWLITQIVGRALILKENKDSRFPNGFTSWQETHYEVVSHLNAVVELPGTKAYISREESGSGGLYQLAEDLTNEFESIHANSGREWDGEFFEEIHEYLEAKDRESIESFNNNNA